MANHYTTPEVEVVVLSEEDVITASLSTDNPGEGWGDIF